jgi:hypothetical protein
VALSETNKRKLQELGIGLHGNIETLLMLVKNVGATGNKLPNYISTSVRSYTDKLEIIEEFPTDCPVMGISFKDGEYHLSVWNWVPGPGPGDFEISFNHEEDAMNFILSYYFGDNPYFEERRVYEEKKH